jgi:hydrogenase maturation protease
LIRNRILVYGYGNPGRQDDGLGPAFIELLDADEIPGVVTDCNYQLQIEDAVAVSESDAVIFVDAASSGDEPFTFNEIGPTGETSFTTHSVSPGSLLALCREIYRKKVRAHLLAIRGYEWDFVGELTPGAEKNLDLAHRFFKNKIHDIIKSDARH